MLINRVVSIKPDLRLALTTVHELCETVNTPRSLAVSLCLQYEEWGEYLDLPMDPSVYEDPGNFARDYLVTSILKKHPGMPLGIDRVAVALQSFKDSEEQCRITNLRLKGNHDPRLAAISREISNIIGPLTDADLDFVETSFRHGGGATTGVRGQGSSPSDKYDETIHLTADLIPYYRSIIGEQWWEYHRKPVMVVEGSKFTTVPKTAKTDRGICVEPTLNIYCQLGIGALLRKKLKRVGIDLNQQDRNRYLASVAWRDSLATIDLSAASDSVSTSLMLQVFSLRWIELFSICRSHRCYYDGEWHELEKWSSMGNGYTFELETLLFLAVCYSVIPKDDRACVSVYGDDIIVPQKYAQDVIDTLNFVGFKVNTSKSFLAGNFFESCGHDYFKGINVRPFYLREEEAIPFSVQAANKLRLFSRRMNVDMSCDETYLPVWRSLMRKVPRKWKRCLVPISFGDAGILVSKDEANPAPLARGFEGHLVRHISLTPMYKRKLTFGVLLAALARMTVGSPGFSLEKPLLTSLFTKGKEPRRGLFGQPVTRLSTVSRWDDGLEWRPPIL